MSGLDAETLAEVSQVIRAYLMDETDVTRPSFHATALTVRLGVLLDRSEQ
jgi:hypothetical protein